MLIMYILKTTRFVSNLTFQNLIIILFFIIIYILLLLTWKLDIPKSNYYIIFYYYIYIIVAHMVSLLLTSVTFKRTFSLLLTWNYLIKNFIVAHMEFHCCSHGIVIIIFIYE